MDIFVIHHNLLNQDCFPNIPVTGLAIQNGLLTEAAHQHPQSK
jgi:hypothetical protein